MPQPLNIPVKDEKVKRVLEQCRRKIIKITGKPVSIVMIGYKDGNTLTFEDIAKAVCCVMEISFKLATRKCRKRPLVIARHLIFYYARQYTNLSHELIAKNLGYNDHTAGVNAVKKVRGFVRSRDEIILSSMKSINQLLNIKS